MSTYEEVIIISNDRPRGYQIRYHEIRGYDSPDRWYSAATLRGRQIGEFATAVDAVAACHADRRKVLASHKRRAK